MIYTSLVLYARNR